MTDDNVWAALNFAVANGSYKLIKNIAASGIDIHLKTNYGVNCLHKAAFVGHLDLCKALVEMQNFNLDMADDDGWTAFHFAARKGSDELIAYFIDMGSNVHLETNDRKNCLHIAALYGHLNLCKILVEKHYFDVHSTDDDGWAALHYSARHGTYSLITYFVDMGADIFLKTKDGKNCLHIAVLYGHSKLCKTLKSRHNFDIHAADNDGWTALHHSVRNGSHELVNCFTKIEADTTLKKNGQESSLLIKKFGRYSDHFKTPVAHNDILKVLRSDERIAHNDEHKALHISTRKDHYKLVKDFADTGSDIYLQTNDGKNCLHIAALYGHLRLCMALYSNYRFDVNMADEDGWAAIHFSARNGSCELVRYFAALRCDIHLKTNDGKNCLHIAALYGHLELCKILKYNFEFDASLTDDLGWTALHFSARNGSHELVSFFASVVTNINLKTNDGMDCLHIAALHGHLNLCSTLINEYKFDIFMPDNDGWTAIHFSVRNGSYELVRYFTNLGGDFHLKTNDGKNCLHIAARYGHLDICKTFVNNHNFDVHLTDNDGFTVLHYSAENGSFDLFLFILEKGSEIYSKTLSMRNVLHLAASNGHYDICKFILEYFFEDYKNNNARNQYMLNGRSYRSQIFYKYDIIFLHAQDIDGNTYLHLAAERNQAKVCELLLKYDTEIISVLNRNNETAREIALDNGHLDVLNTLKAEFVRAGMLFCFTEKKFERFYCLNWTLYCLSHFKRTKS